jgi:excisionase family DNA binding protein
MKPKPTLPTPPMPEILTLPEVCQALRVSRTTVWKLVRDERLPAIRLSRRLKRFLRSDVLALKGDK